MSKSPWVILGVKASSDRDTIRRAYARKLRVTNPEDDPEGFMALRQAYETALGRARRAQIPADDVARPAPPAPNPIAPEPAVVDPERAAAIAAQAAEKADFERARRALLAALKRAQPLPDAELQTLLTALLALPMLDQITARVSFESWLADTIARHLPRSDALIEPAMAEFGWDDNSRSRGGYSAMEAILNRTREWQYVNAARQPATPLHLGWLALTTPRRANWRMRLAVLSPGVEWQVRALLAAADTNLPGIRDWFNADAEAWWRDFASRPRLRLSMLLPLAGILAFLLFDLMTGEPHLLMPVRVLLLVVGLAIPWLILRYVLRPQMAFAANGWRWPMWQRLGWASALALLPALALLLPDHPLSIIAIALLALVAVAWVTITNPLPDTEPSLPRFGAFIGLAWPFGLFGLRMLDKMSFGHAAGWLVMTAALLLILSRGREALAALARHLLPRFTAAALGGIAAVGSLAAAVIGPGLPNPAMVHMVMTVVSPALVLLRIAGDLTPMGRMKLWLIIPWVLVISAMAGSFGSNPDTRRSDPYGPPPIMTAPIDPSAIAPTITAPALIATGHGVQPAGSPEFAKAAQPIRPPDGWVNVDDYHGGLSRPGIYFVDVRLRVSGTGIVMGCDVLRSGGPANIGPRTCEAVAERATFIPATDVSGTAMPSPYLASFVWVVPKGYAPPASTMASPGQPRPRSGIDDWVQFKDYPPGAFETRGDYVIGYTLQLDARGKVDRCSVTASSGDKAVDDRTCAVISKRATFDPPRDAAGQAVPSRYAGKLVWRITRKAAPARPAAFLGRQICPRDTRAADRPGTAQPARGCNGPVIGSGDYPELARAAGKQGATGIEFTIGTDGIVTQCNVTRSSGSGALDDASCRLVKQRTRFLPALDAAGQPITETKETNVQWELD